MSEASIPVDLRNPGQVFACLGFLEAAEVLFGDAMGGFAWTEAQARFVVTAAATEQPFAGVLAFVAREPVVRCAPEAFKDEEVKAAREKAEAAEKKKATMKRGTATKVRQSKSAAEERPTADEAQDQIEDDSDGGSTDGPIKVVEFFPNREPQAATLPLRIGDRLHIGHWADGSSRWDFKLFAGQQRAPAIARTMIKALRQIHDRDAVTLAGNPFGPVVAMGGSSFNLDARKAWTGIDAGYSPNDEEPTLVYASPVVEILGAIGLEHARPIEAERRIVAYSAWGAPLPPSLARAALAGAPLGIPLRDFRFLLLHKGKNKAVTHADEETIR